jgi:hypothetical protein
LQWLQDSNQINWEILNNIRRETSRQFKGGKGEYVEEKITEFTTHSKNKNIKELYIGINESKMCYQRRANLVKDENGDLLYLGNTK